MMKRLLFFALLIGAMVLVWSTFAYAAPTKPPLPEMEIETITLPPLPLP